jgi:glycosyltransferase involved in cell wall biosynthesis
MPTEYRGSQKPKREDGRDQMGCEEGKILDGQEQERLLGIPFDQYQRYRLVSDVINKFRDNGQAFKIIEVGASIEGNLKRFLPQDNIYFLDKEYPPDYLDKDNYIVADITKTDLDETYDFVVAVDTYEHIPEDSREKFVEGLISSSNIATIIAAPFDTPGVREHEAIANEVYRHTHGTDHRWLQEHISNGLPSLSKTTGIIERCGLKYQVIPSGYLPRWFEMISLYLLTEGEPKFTKAMEELSKFYNKNVYRYDNQDPAYRQVIVVAKNEDLPDLSDLYQTCPDLSELEDAQRSLKFIIENIRCLYDISCRGTPIDLRLEIEIKDRAINALRDQLKKYEIQAQEFESQAEKFEDQAQIFEKALKKSEEQISVISDEKKLLEDQAQRFESQAQVFQRELESSEGRVRELNAQIDAAIDRALRAEREVSDMQRSILWQLTTKYHNGFIDRFMPLGTSRRRAYDTGLNAGRFLANDGLSSIARDREDKKKIDAYRECTEPQDLHISGCDDERLETIEKKVSIIIPTKDPGPDFRFALEKIKGQRGVKEVEVLVIDSGSSDETLTLAKRYGSKVHSIRPEDFDHGLTRNLAAEMATGDYLLFMVQDAIPIGDRWLHDMANALESDGKIAAATCRQLPKSDADLFACFSMYSHQRAMEFIKDRVASPRADLNSLSQIERRKLSGLEDVCTIVRSDVFKKLKFRPGYAEDLDLGMRILKDNHRIAFLHSCGVVHSHNRKPDYFLKRIYVDNKALHKILPEANIAPDRREIGEVMGGIVCLYTSLKASLASMADLQFGDLAAMFEDLKRLITENSESSKNREKEINAIPGPLDVILQEMQEATQSRETMPDQGPIESYFQLLESFQKYMEIYGSLKDREMEFKRAIYKLFTIAAGSELSHYAVSKQGSADDRLKDLDSLLSGGI